MPIDARSALEGKIDLIERVRVIELLDAEPMPRVIDEVA